MARLPLLLAATCLGTVAALLGGRALLQGAAAPTPETSTATLEGTLQWSPDPGRRREASLLLESRAEGDPRRQRQLLRSQGWGPDSLAALVLKREALAAEGLGRQQEAEGLWRELRRRFPSSPASADALYSLGRSRPPLRRELLQRFPAHPAALAAALEQGPAPAERLAGALHLARWGARWPGAEERFREHCGGGSARKLPPAARARLAEALAELGDGPAAQECLGTAAKLSTSGTLALAKALLHGEGPSKEQALALLLAVSRQQQGPEAEEAVRLLSQQEGPAATATLAQLPRRWRTSAAVEARAALADPSGRGALEVVRRWPRDPATWDLQWELVRRSLLSGGWSGAIALLEALPAEGLPPPLAARHRFWMGYAQRELGRDEAATASWRELLLRHPGGYYGWRAAVQLGEGDPGLAAAPGGDSQAGRDRWQPLASGDRDLDRLWRLDQRTEAWEVWRDRRGSAAPQEARELLVEGRLRMGVGDDWTGLAQLERASLRLPPEQCELEPQLERSLHPLRFPGVFAAAARAQGLPMALLLGVAKQESRFTPTVRSPAGAVGLMQLLPSTASEVAGEPVGSADLKQPERNAELGSRYLKGLLERWKGDPLPAVASYNAGAGAVQGWVNPLLQRAPEVWVEAIPYPETRLYVKKVLGNAWSYLRPRLPRC